MKIGIIGSGYVGLVTGSCLSDFGHKVVCFDKDENKIQNLRECKVPIFEPGLDVIINRNIKASRLSFEVSFVDKLGEMDAIFVAVGTPSNDSDGSADTTSLEDVFSQLKSSVMPNQVIIIKSTVPVGTNSAMYNMISAQTAQNFNVVSNPEF